MHDFVRDEVAKHEIGREDEAPIERQVPARRAVAPLCSLVYHVDLTGLLPDARRQRRDALGNCGTRPSSQPVLQSAGRRRSCLQAAPHDNLPFAPPDEVAARFRFGDLHPHRGRLAAAQDFVGLTSRRPPQGAQTRHAFELSEHPALVAEQEGRRLLLANADRLDDLDTARPTRRRDWRAALETTTS